MPHAYEENNMDVMWYIISSFSTTNHADNSYITSLSYQKNAKKAIYSLWYFVLHHLQPTKIVKVLSNQKISIESEDYNDNYSILTSKVKGLLTNR